MPVNEIDETRALVTLEEARLHAFRDAGDSSRDELLIEAINMVSSSIWAHCEREFLPSASAARTFELRRMLRNGSWVGWIDLCPFEVRAVTQVQLYPDTASPQTLTADEYRLFPVGGALGGTYLELVTVEPAAAEEQPGFGWQATVTATWGMSAVPGDVRLAALQWIDNLVKNPGSYQSVEMGGFSVVPDFDVGAAVRAGMPSAVKHRLLGYCRSIR